MDTINQTFLTNQNAVQEAEKTKLEILEEFKHPMEVNTNLLMKILADNKDTEYGKKYHFADIHTVEDYQRMVPVITYDDIGAYTERMADGEKNVLTAYPLDHMNTTAGTTGFYKLIPFTSELAKSFVRYNKHWIDALKGEQLDPAWMEGRAFCTSEGTCTKRESGITVGCASSKMAEYIRGGADALDAILRILYTSPYEATNPAPQSDSKYLHVRFAMMDKNITGIITGFYSQISQIFQYIAGNYKMLIHDIATGTIDPSIDLPEEVRESILRKIQPMPERAAELEEIFKNGADHCFVPQIWPKLIYMYGVGGDGFSIYDKTMKERFTNNCVKNIYAGVNASEGIWSIPVKLDMEDGALAPGSAFMEFLPVDADGDISKIVTMDKLEVGQTYELVITNLAGFYRYRMSDAVQVTGFYEKTPLVRFMFRVNRVISMVNEKITEHALQNVVEATSKKLGFDLADFNVYPNYDGDLPRYNFLIEPRNVVDHISREQLQEALFEEIYKLPRFSVFYDGGKLGKPEAWWLQPESNMLYRDIMVYRGAPANQLKPVRVILNEKQRKFFFALREF